MWVTVKQFNFVPKGQYHAWYILQLLNMLVGGLVNGMAFN